MAAGKTIRFVQTASPLRRPPEQRETLKGLGLNKVRRERTLEHTGPTLGMFVKVAHMVKAYDEDGAEVSREEAIARLGRLRDEARAKRA